MDDPLGEELLGSEQRESIGEVEAHLMAEDGEGAGAGAIVLLPTRRQNVLQQIQILAHGSLLPEA